MGGGGKGVDGDVPRARSYSVYIFHLISFEFGT